MILMNPSASHSRRAFHFNPPRHPLKRSPFRKSLAPPALPEIVSGGPPAKWPGGIDFGTRNPFAALWGFFDPSGIFWLAGELYERGKPLSDYFARLPSKLGERRLGPAGRELAPVG